MQRILYIIFILFATNLFGQNPIMTINGNDVIFNTNSVVQINGKLEIKENGTLEQYGSDVNIIDDLLLSGTLRIHDGNMFIGNGNQASIIYLDNRTINPTLLEILGGELFVVNSFIPLDPSRVISFIMSGGLFKLGYESINLGTGYGLFHIVSSSSSFNMSGGIIELLRDVDDISEEFYIENVSNNVSGGLVKIVAEEINQNFEMNSQVPIYEFEIDGANNPIVTLNNDLQVTSDITLAGAGSDRFILNTNELQVGGDFNNNFSAQDGFDATNSTVTLNGSNLQNIQGSQQSTFGLLRVNKSAGNVEINQPTRIEDDLYLVSNTIIDLNNNDLTLSEDAFIYSDNGSNKQINVGFSVNKTIINSGSDIDPLQGAYLVKELPTSYVGTFDFPFPISTPGVYTPALITFNPSGVSIASNAKIKVKPVPQEHPEVESSNISLEKYWVIKSENITVNNNGINLRGFYDNSEVNGSEGSYQILAFSPPYDNPLGYWRINPGEAADIVDFNGKLWYSQQISFLDGDWTVGERNAARAIYYARQDGDWDDPNTWSKVYYDGAASTTIPNKLSDVVRIQNHVITVNSATAAVNLISVEDGTEGRDPGILVLADNYYLQGDTFRLEDNTIIKIENENGIEITPASSGAIRNDIVQLSEDAEYWFVGSNIQNTGDGLPNIIRKFVVDKDPASLVELGLSISISDSLVIEDGILDLSDKSINGLIPNRSISMNGGELIIRSNFPSNYTSPYFNYGKITFDGTGSVQIPSSGSTPGVTQYNDLSIKGNRSGDITFRQNGLINIKNDFEIDELNFANNTFRFQSFGSTIVFNKNGANQLIPTDPQSPSDSVCRLEYYNLVLDSSGTKQLSSVSNSLFVVKNNLTINNNADFESNGFDLMTLGNWLNNSGTFNPGNNFVIFNSDVINQVKNITVRDTTDNPFYNVKIMGAGKVEPLDDILVNNDIIIDSLSTLKMLNNSLTSKGNWVNNSGTFEYGTSEVYFIGNSIQSITKTIGNQQFYDLIIDNINNVNSQNVGTNSNEGIIVNNNLTLSNGYIDARGRFVTVLNTLTRPGGGYIDGELRKNIAQDANNIVFEVGYESRYLPAELNFTGTGGTSGLIGVLSDTVNTTSSPISWNAEPPTDLLPLGSTMSEDKHVARQWNITIPSGSSFALGANRKFDATFNFVSGAEPSGDLRNGANTNLFEARVYNGSEWIFPFYYSTYPLMGTKTANSTQYLDLIDFGAFVIGEPGALTFYTRADGNWDEPSNWSLQGYGGLAANEYPGENNNVFRAFIGDDNIIDLNLNITVNDGSLGDGLVAVDSSGYLNLQNFVFSGTGAFRLDKFSTLEIGATDGIAQSGATGNVQTTDRDFNYNGHNKGTFVYSSNGNQSSGNGLPNGLDTTYTLVINKTSGTLTLNTPANLHVLNEIDIQSGIFSPGSLDLFVYRDFRKSSGAEFLPNGRTVYLRGNFAVNFYADNYNEPFNLYNLNIGKSFNTGDIFLQANTTLNILNSLTFESNNKSIIDATTYSTDAVPLYVSFEPSATTNGAGHISLTLSGGWVFGEVRKNIVANDAPEVTFETGSQFYYSPYAIDFAAGSGSTAGYLGAKAIEGSHPKLYSDPPSLYPVSYSRNISVYWRLTKPSSSTFVRGDRNANYRVYFINPDQQTNTDCFGCADLTFYRGGADSLQWWQTMSLNGTGENSNNGSGLCGDTRIAPHPTPNFSYSGDPCNSSNTLVYIQVNNVPSTYAFGSEETFASGDLLLADFVAGNRNSIKFYTFFSINDGDWSDPNTWSTVSYSSTVNEAALDNDPLIRPVPYRQYDNVYIGNGKKVKLDVLVGTNNITFPVSQYTFAGPSVFVEDGGTLDFGTSVLRGNQFNALKGSTIKIGSNEGIIAGVNAQTGNVQYRYTAAVFNDSINVVYAPNGRTSNGTQRQLVDRNSLTHYIESVTIRRSSDNSIVLQHTTDDKYRVDRYANYRANASCSLNVGESYYIEVNPSTGPNRQYYAWANWNFDYATWTQLDSDESNNDNLVTLGPFTVPAANNQGTTFLRIGMGGNTSNFTATTANTNQTSSGEFEDYTIHIINPNYVANQNTGSALPTILKSFTVHSLNPGATDPRVNLGKDIIVLDSIKFQSGRFIQGNNDIDLYGDFVHDTTNGFSAHTTAPISLLGDNNQEIRGSAPITFNNFNINKNNSLATILFDNDITFNNNFNYLSDNISILSDNRTLLFEQNSVLNGNFENTRMIRLSGTVNSGEITKRFTSAGGSANPKEFLFPIGYASDYYSVFVYDTASTYSGNPEITLSYVEGKHPNRLSENMLAQYWPVNSSVFTNLDTMIIQYDDTKINGDFSKYIPALYTSEWEINVGRNPQIDLSQMVLNITDYINGDWTAGETGSFFAGRRFYSRNTGDWSNPLNWSNDQVLKHAGPPSSYYPGDIYSQDTVHIDGHVISYDLIANMVDSIRVGGTNPNPPAGVLTFNSTNSKSLNVRSVFIDNDNGIINGVNSGNRIDTLSIKGNLINNSTAGLDLFNNSNNFTVLNFIETGNSAIEGNGNFNDFGRIILNKDGGLSDTLINSSSTFAQATVNSTDYQFALNKGVLDHSINESLSLGTGNDAVMEPFSALLIEDGEVIVNGSLSTNSNTFITIDGGDLKVGSALDENFVYQTGTKVDIIQGRFEIAGAFTRLFSNSEIDLNLSANGEILTSKVGYTDPSKIAFDLSNSTSIFNMAGGRIIVANSNPAASYDAFINAAVGTLMTGGTLQIGDSANTVNNSTFKLGGNMPINNLHLTNNGINTINTQLLEASYTVNNLFEVDEIHTFNLNGNILNLGGDIINNGIFNATPSAATTDPWLVSFFGNQTQNIINNTGNSLDFFNLQMKKSDNQVLLSSTAGSNLKIKNTLEFTSVNDAIIDASTNNKFVEVSPFAFNNTNVLRTGNGHVFGRLYRYVKEGNRNIFYPVGADSLTNYRPANFIVSSALNTAGLVGIINYDGQHPDFDNTIINDNNYVNTWWNVNLPASGQFQLGSGQSYSLKTQFRNPEDLIGTGDYLFFEHFTYNPPYPSAGNWEFSNTTDISSTSITSSGNTEFIDFAIGEPEGVTFYSFNSGSWTDPNTWSLSGYEIPNTPVRFPNLNTDIVRIGNNKRVFLPDLTYPEIRSVFVEKYNGNPGTLKIEGDLGYLRGNTFVLEDSCTIELDHLQGIQPASFGQTGAVQTDSRVFGKSRYVYNSPSGSQTTGLGLPSLVKTIIIDNPSTSNKTVFLSNDGSPVVNVQDTLYIRQGIFDSGNRGLRIYSEVIIDSVVNNGVFEPLQANVFFGGTNDDKFIIISNNSGMNFYDITLESGNLLVRREGVFNPNKADVFVDNNLDFVSNSIVDLGDNVNWFMRNENPNSIINYAPNRYIRTSRTSGSLVRNISSSGLPKTYFYPVGSFEGVDNYAPVELTVESGVSSGYISMRTSPGDYGGFPGGHTGINNNPNAEYQERYWGIDTVSANINGKLKFNYIDSEFFGPESNMSRLGRWRPALENTPGAWFQQPIPNIDLTANYFETTNNYSSSEFEGDWTLGNIFAFRRIFYSRQNGNWSDPNAWTFNPTHSGPIFGPGIWPNSTEDSVVIGGGDAVLAKHEIILDQNVNVQGTALGTNVNNRGILNTNGFILEGDFFTMANLSHLKISSPVGISSLSTPTGNIQTDVSREFAPLGIYEYNGTQNQVIGNGLPNQFEELIINNTGNAITNDNNVLLDKDIVINSDLNVLAGAFNMATFKADKPASAGDLNIAANAQIRIAGTNNMLDVLNNYINYNIDEFSLFNFYGSNQVISTLPSNVLNGYGNVSVQNPGIKSVIAPLLIRGNLYISDNATLQNDVGNNSLSVRKNIVNSAQVNNYGIIEIGN